MLDTEFTSILDTHAYLRLPGPWPRALINFPYRQDKGCAKVIEPRDDIDICAIQSEVIGFETAIQSKMLSEVELVNTGGIDQPEHFALDEQNIC